MRDVVCFDLDGTLMDPGGSIRASLDHAVRSGGHEPFAAKEVLIGMPLRDILRTRTKDAQAIESMVGEFRRYYVEEAWRLVSFYPGVREALETLREHDVQTAIVTTKGEQEAIDLMRHMQVSHLFDTIVGDDDVRPLKPDPAPVIAACGRLGRQAKDAVMIGDTRFDVEAGRAAGAYTIGVKWGSGWAWGAEPTAAHVLAEDAKHMLELIHAWRR